MTPERTATREEWLAERAELRKLEDEHSKRGQELAEKRRQLPWVPVEKEYTLATDDGPKTLAEIFDGRSQLLAYNIMYGPDYSLGACPGCSNLADHFDAGLVHLNHRDVTFVGFSRAPLERLQAYKKRMGWQFPWVSTYDSDFAFDLDLAVSPEQAGEIDEIRQMVEDPPDWLQNWSEQVGADLKDGLREAPSWIAFALEDGVVYHTYTSTPPDRETGPYFYLLLDRTSRGADSGPPFNLRNDEYDEDTRL
jgi:predicted dithiol-disulfide oxidoreductase (DUF899 family)